MKIYVCSHTHWDREWYIPFAAFHMQLVAHVDTLLEVLERDASFRVFNFDAQTVWIEDYCDLRPENEARLKKCIQEGRITCGPWYVLPDEFLSSGEALIRNLLRGKRIAHAYGCDSRVGYLCDMFGHTGQMPSLLAECGCEAAIIWRGISSETLPYEFIWEAQDGTRMLTHRIEETVGYGYGSFSPWAIGALLGVKVTSEELADITTKARLFIACAKKIAERTMTDVVYFSHGIDHMVPDPTLPQWLACAREMAPQHEIIHASFDEYIAALCTATQNVTLPVVKGELRDVNCVPYKKHHVPVNFLLPGIISTRTDVKMRMYDVEHSVRDLVEPCVTCACARGDISGDSLAHVVLERAWRDFLRCHPHDSSGCCSVDAIPRDMLSRLAAAEEYADAARRICVEAYASKNALSLTLAEGDTQDVLILLSAPHGGRATGTVSVPLPPDVPPEQCDLSLYGVAATCVREEIMTRPMTVVFPGQYEELRRVATYSINCADAPGTAWIHGRITRTETPLIRTEKRVPSATLENDILSVTITDAGHISLTDMRTNVTYDNIISLEDSADAGDTYSFSPPPHDTVIRQWNLQALYADTATPGVRRARMKACMHIPRGLTPDRQTRTEETVALPCEFIFTVWDDIPRLDVQVSLENTANNHRVRVRVATGIAASHTVSNGHYSHILRPAACPEKPDENAWIEDPPPEAPHEEWCAVWDDTHGMAIRTYGLHEHEYLSDRNGTLALTLMRCVDMLSEKDIVRRKGGAGPAIPTPGAQMHGRYTFAFSLMPLTGASPLRTVQQESARCATHMQAYAIAPQKTEREPDCFLAVEGATLGACKMAEDGTGIVLRLAPTETSDSTTYVRLPHISPGGMPSRVRADECTRVHDASITQEGDTYVCQTLPGQMCTIRIPLPHQ